MQRKFMVVLGAVLVFSFGASTRSFAGELQDLTKKVGALEKDVQNLEVQTVTDAGEHKVETFAADKIHFGGFATVDADALFGKSTATQYSFHETDIDVLLSADVTPKLNVFVDVGFVCDVELKNQNAAWRGFGDRTMEFDLEIGTIRYHFNDSLELSLGRLVAPFGIINVERFEPLMLQPEKPQALRGISDTVFTFFDLQVNGLQVTGKLPSGKSTLGYAAYVSTTSGDTRAMGGGGRLFLGLPKDVVTIGVSNQTAQRGGQTYSALGGDLKIKWQHFTWRSEYLRGIIKGVRDQQAFYVQPSYSFFDGKFILFGQVDYLDDSLGVVTVDHDQDGGALTAEIADPIKKYEYTAGVNYIPLPSLRLRGVFTVNDYRGATATLGGLNRDYYLTELSATVSF